MSTPWQRSQAGDTPPGTNPSAPSMPPVIPGAPVYPGYPVNAPVPPYMAPGYYPQAPMPPSAPPYTPYAVPPAVPVPSGAPASDPVLELSPLDQLRLRIQNGLGGIRQTTVFVGNIADGVTDELLTSLFSACGLVKKWKRVLEASGSPKSFGFLDYELAEGLLRFMRLLSNIPLLGKNLAVKAEDSTKDYLSRYVQGLKDYESSNANSPRLSSTLEDDLKALDELNLILKQRNLVPAMQFIERKVHELTIGPIEEPEPVMEKLATPEVPSKNENSHQTGPEAKKPRTSSLTGWDAPSFKERERRWEARENSQAKSRHHNRDREEAKRADEIEDKTKLVNWLNNFDDSTFFFQAMDLLSLDGDAELCQVLSTADAPSFYWDRARWSERRQRELQKQLEFDAREERRDAEALSRRQVSKPVSSRARPPLVPISFTFNELIAAGYSQDEANTKLQELKKDKIRALIALIPTEQEPLFAWDLEWELVELEKVGAWIQKNVAAWDEVKEKTILIEDLEAWIRSHMPANEMLQNLDGLPGADLFVMRLWRYLVYETEAKAHGLQ